MLVYFAAPFSLSDGVASQNPPDWPFLFYAPNLNFERNSHFFPWHLFIIPKAGMKWIFALSCGAVITGFYKRFRWAPLKTRSITYLN